MKIVVFSGAGMSAESGISTFRDTGGLWEHYKIEEVATPAAWNANPTLVQNFYNLRRKQIIEAQPNEAHLYCKELEKIGEVTIITQNIDDLHERAGSLNVLHLHGNIRLAKSSGPNQETHYYPIEGWELKMGEFCSEGFQLRPHVVWFGEDVPNYEIAKTVIENADILIVIGTSLKVYPAAGLIHYSKNTTLKFIIDPHLDEFNIPKDFIELKEEASEGMLQCLGYLKEKSGLF